MVNNICEPNSAYFTSIIQNNWLKMRVNKHVLPENIGKKLQVCTQCKLQIFIENYKYL
jgi:hypothetical protein